MKNKKLLAVAGLAGILAVGGTLAYFSQEHVAVNEISTSSYGSEMTETFTPPSEFTPGVEVKKEVGVTNIENADVVVRMKFEESWSRNGVAFESRNALDTMRETSAVEKNLTEAGWTHAADGWFYYNSKLIQGNTASLLSSIRLKENADMGTYNTIFSYVVVDASGNETAKKGTVPAAYIITENGKQVIDLKMLAESLNMAEGENLKTSVKTEVNQAASGYSNADYALTVTAQTCQATDKAVKAYFFQGTVPADLTQIVAGWALKAEDLQ